jgi:HEAT repeat protein
MKFAFSAHRKLILNFDVDAMHKSKRTMRLCVILFTIHLCSPAGTTSVDGGIALQREKRNQEEVGIESDSHSSELLTQTRLAELIQGLCSEKAELREQAVSELLPHTETAGPAVVETLIDGKPDSRSSALEILNAWGAPTTGIDATDRATITLERVHRLDDWVYGYSETSELTAEEIPDGVAKRTNEIIDQLLGKTKVDAELLDELEKNCEISIHVIKQLGVQESLSKNKHSKLRGIRYWLQAGQTLRKEYRKQLFQLASEEVQTRQNAFRLLSPHFSPYDRRVLIELFSHPDEQLRIAAIKELKHFNPVRTKVILGMLLKDERDSVRAATVEAIEKTASFNLEIELQELIESETNEKILVNALKKLDEVAVWSERTDFEMNTELWRLLLRKAEHRNAKVRMYVALMLRDSVRYASLDNKLEETLKLQIDATLDELCLDPDTEVARTAFRSFRPNPTEKSCVLLNRIFKSHPSNAIEYVDSLENCLRNNFRLSDADRKRWKEDCLVPMLESYLSDENANFRNAALIGLHRQYKYSVLDHMKKLVQDENREVRLNALRILAIRSQRTYPYWLAMDDSADAAASLLMEQFADAMTNVGRFAIKIVNEFRAWFFNRFDGKIYFNSMTDLEIDERMPPLYEEMLIEHRNKVQRAKRHSKKLVPILIEIAGSDDPEESQWAALCLVLMGHWQEGLPVLMNCKKCYFQFYPPERELSWRMFECVPFRERSELFKHLVELEDSKSSFLPIMFAKVRNHDGTDVLWDLVERDRIDVRIAREAIVSVVLGLEHGWVYDATVNKALRNHLKSEIEKKLLSSNERALVTAALIADTWFPELRGEIEDAYDQCETWDMRLQMLPIIHRNMELAELIKSYDEAAAYYAMRRSASLRLASIGYRFEFRLPSYLDMNLISPYIQSDDIRVRAHATYWMIQQGENVSLLPLYEYWESVAEDSDTMLRSEVAWMLADAAAKRNDPLLDSLVEEIYEKYTQSDKRIYGLDIFYWATRSMVGPKAMSVRAQLRKRYWDKLFERKY